MNAYKELLSQIAAASESLNQAADEASETISSIEKKLLGAEPGVTVWHATILKEETSHEDAEVAQRRVALGFGKARSKWGIVVRDEVFGKKRPRDTEYTERLGGEISLLRKSDRDLRIVAVPYLTGLLGDILSALTARADKLQPVAEASAAEEASEPAAETTVDFSAEPAQA